MNNEEIYKILEGNGTSDYEIYIKTKELFSCQDNITTLCNQDELMFQIIHQVEELWMKLISCTLCDVMDYIGCKNTRRVITLFKRIHKLQTMMIDQLLVLETMSPKEYHEIRKKLGKGSGIDSPGFRAILKIIQPLWTSFVKNYLNNDLTNIEKIYYSEYNHDDSYIIAESLTDFDELFQIFRYRHMKLVARSIGLGSKSLKGKPATLLENGAKHQLFPHLWEIRNIITTKETASY